MVKGKGSKDGKPPKPDPFRENKFEACNFCHQDQCRCLISTDGNFEGEKPVSINLDGIKGAIPPGVILPDGRIMGEETKESPLFTPPEENQDLPIIYSAPEEWDWDDQSEVQDFLDKLQEITYDVYENSPMSEDDKRHVYLKSVNMFQSVKGSTKDSSYLVNTLNFAMGLINTIKGSPSDKNLNYDIEESDSEPIDQEAFNSKEFKDAVNNLDVETTKMSVILSTIRTEHPKFFPDLVDKLNESLDVLPPSIVRHVLSKLSHATERSEEKELISFLNGVEFGFTQKEESSIVKASKILPDLSTELTTLTRKQEELVKSQSEMFDLMKNYFDKKLGAISKIEPRLLILENKARFSETRASTSHAHSVSQIKTTTKVAPSINKRGTYKYGGLLITLNKGKAEYMALDKGADTVEWVTLIKLLKKYRDNPKVLSSIFKRDPKEVMNVVGDNLDNAPALLNTIKEDCRTYIFLA